MTIFAIMVLVGALGWFLMGVFEGEKPIIKVQPLPRFLTGGQKFTLAVSDMKRGLKELDVLVMQEGREIKILEKKFPSKVFSTRRGPINLKRNFPSIPQN